MWGASSRSFRPNSACGSIETTTIGKTQPTLSFSPINTASQANRTRNQLTITNQIKNQKSQQKTINQIRNQATITTNLRNQLRNQIKRPDSKQLQWYYTYKGPAKMLVTCHICHQHRGNKLDQLQRYHFSVQNDFES